MTLLTRLIGEQLNGRKSVKQQMGEDLTTGQLGLLTLKRPYVASHFILIHNINPNSRGIYILHVPFKTVGSMSDICTMSCIFKKSNLN